MRFGHEGNAVKRKHLQEKLDQAVAAKDMNLLYGVYAEGKNIMIYDYRTRK